jgi:hypothetical protein
MALRIEKGEGGGWRGDDCKVKYAMLCLPRWCSRRAHKDATTQRWPACLLPPPPPRGPHSTSTHLDASSSMIKPEVSSKKTEHPVHPTPLSCLQLAPPQTWHFVRIDFTVIPKSGLKSPISWVSNTAGASHDIHDPSHHHHNSRLEHAAAYLDM